MWNISADPQQFSEAVAWFRNRIPLKKEEWLQLEEQARRKAFTVAGVLQLDLITEVWESLDKAISKGTPLEEFKRDVAAKLYTAWGGEKPWRVDLLFRTNVQLAYSAGRYKAMTDPDVLAVRPFWQFDGVLDDRTSPICSQLDGVIRPADDPWWDTHTPPLHFQCRSGIISLREPGSKGVTESPPAEPPAAGFGSRPGADEWEPDVSAYPPELRTAYEAKTARVAAPD